MIIKLSGQRGHRHDSKIQNSRSQRPKQGRTSSAALQHADLMAQRDHLEHQLSAALRFAGGDRNRFRRFGIAMRKAYRPIFTITNQSAWPKF
jgi:hypothetical protein